MSKTTIAKSADISCKHRAALAAVDFLIVPTVKFDVLHVFVVIERARRRVVHINVTAHPTAKWISQQITEAFPFESAPRY